MLISTALLLDSNIRNVHVLRQNCRAAGWWREKKDFLTNVKVTFLENV
jgi:hypothetical protein